jgi:predicted metal-dependent phosphoesterase TrpH
LLGPGYSFRILDFRHFGFLIMMLFDLHLHTDYYSSCSAISPEELIRQAVALKLDGVAFTEHGIRWPDDKFDHIRKLAEPHELLLIDAQEVQTYSPEKGMEGEFLVFGVKKSLGSDFSAKALVERVHGEGGILIAAHPYKWSRFGKDRYYGAGDRIYELELDGIELFHPDHDEEAITKVRQAMEKLGLPGTGGSDAHQVHEIGTCLTLFEKEVRNEEDFIRQIRDGRIQAVGNPMFKRLDTKR